MKLLRAERGQSTVEFALVLPLVLMLILALMQVGVLLVNQLMVFGAAREGVREAIVNPSHSDIESAARAAAPGLHLSTEIQRGTERGDPAWVQVTAEPVQLPLVGVIVSRVTLEADATMRMERSDDVD